MSTRIEASVLDTTPLVLKACCDGYEKRIRFRNGIANLRYAEVLKKVARSLRLVDVDFNLRWTDDDGEQVDIVDEDDLGEAIAYFAPSDPHRDDEPVTIPVEVFVDAGISLSDYEGSVYAEEQTGEREGPVFDAQQHQAESTIGGSISSQDLDSDDDAATFRSSDRNAPRSSHVDHGDDDDRAEDAMAGWSEERRALCLRWQDSCHGRAQALEVMSLSSRSPSMSSTSMHSWSQAGSSRYDVELESAKGSGQGSSSLQFFGGHERSNRLHTRVRCSACKCSPIQGPRYHCASCPKPADFCQACELSGRAVRDTLSHEDSHIVIKIPDALHGHSVAQRVGLLLQQVRTRLMQEARETGGDGVLAVEEPSTSSNARSISAPTWQQTRSALTCSVCTVILSGPYFLCANCPIVTEDSRDGFLLCATCEQDSLYHHPAHFFLKISGYPERTTDGTQHTRTPLGDRREIRETVVGGALLPPLYMSNRLLPELQDANSPREEFVPLQDIVHSAIMCDSCFQLIRGTWYCCTNCIPFHDLCERCEADTSHDPKHAFAVFKQQVDMDLFKSVVDHQDAGDRIGPARPLLQVTLA